MSEKPSDQTPLQQLMPLTQFTAQEIADIRHLISIAVWIRSEQMGQKDVMRVLMPDDTPAVTLDTRALNARNCQRDMAYGQAWFKELTTRLEALGVDPMTATAVWRTKK